MTIHNDTLNFNGTSIKISTGKLATRADFSVVIEWGQTTLLITSSLGAKPSDRDFLPLSVDFQENLYAAGKIPGSFFRREGRPSTYSVLGARIIDRSIRNLFPKSYRHEIQLIIQPLAVDHTIDLRVPALLATSLVLNAGTSPFATPIAAVNVGYIDGEFVLNPEMKGKAVNNLDLFLTGSIDKINMIEVGANGLSEEKLFAAIEFGHAKIKELIAFQLPFLKKVAKAKAEFVVVDNSKLVAEITKKHSEKMTMLLGTADNNQKDADYGAWVSDLVTELATTDNAKYSEAEVAAAAEKAIANTLRSTTVSTKKRVDGRSFDQLRPLHGEIDLFKQVHGSSLFQRGDTQTLSTVTLGPLSSGLIIDNITLDEYSNFFHHYKSLPFAYGGVGRILGTSRREIGHGALVEKALHYVVPKAENFPYTVRIVSEVLSSDGSTSQAAICSSSLGLMTAGVPMKEAVAGIAIGLIYDGKNYHLLTDIQAWEDFYGDMDFKLAGGQHGIYAGQLDIKIDGLPLDVIKKILEQSKIARLQILVEMNKVISGSKSALPGTVMKFKKITVPVDSIGLVIGPGGKNIKHITAECDNANIEIKDDGSVFIYHKSDTVIAQVVKMVNDSVESGSERGGSRGGDRGESRGGDRGGSRGGDRGGSRGGDRGGSRGGFGGGRGGDRGGSRGSDRGGSRGGDRGGSRSGPEKLPEIGDVDSGQIVSIKEYGLFIELSKSKATGLMHLSRMPKKFTKSLERNFNLGEELKVKVVGIDEQKRVSIEWADSKS